MGITLHITGILKATLIWFNALIKYLTGAVPAHATVACSDKDQENRIGHRLGGRVSNKTFYL